ncbi:decaprenylphospho-beta-D-ribofuranose 2-oxidase [Actinopolyspora mzabensis]|uniref:Decaprenylphospho-beta-D-ribofuranose 2-oxidase n=1 Tax=Actinopolyspora mzabensis TaxID=995066 RepID=A0A1G9APV4_ACTMZ|nr:FAD-binding oxidoreductase [Actinopolyspora mzabensis]SDK29348.1 decaprenylphospho-beta-D-ribofuranose 2-oxidase [Actinopolyspora mzabensis]
MLTGWGRTAPTMADVISTPDVETIARAVREAGPRGVIARGLGRSYGDPAQNAGGTVIDMTALDRIHTIDVDNAAIDVDAGVSLDTLMRRLLPHGLWLPVLPGTRQVTVGGAIGADIHGKNHHSQGSFGSHVISLDLLTADGEVRTLTPDGDSPELFWATVGGMGMTGIVVRATIRLKRVETAYFVVDNIQTRNLDELLEHFTDGSDEDYVYSVAWFDSLARGDRMGRALLTRGNPATLDELPKKLRKNPLGFDAPQLMTAPPIFPNGLVNKYTITAFNEVWYRKAPTKYGSVQNITQFFHPLDLVGEWNRVYGSNGFLQYQFMVPFGQERMFRRSIDKISASGHVSFLNVLKTFGPGNAAPMSFPDKGWTLTVDIPVTPGLDRLCRELDEMVLEADGRLYLAKESRTTPEMIERMYPRIDEWRKTRAAVDPEGIFRSDLARRLNL